MHDLLFLQSAHSAQDQIIVLRPVIRRAQSQFLDQFRLHQKKMADIVIGQEKIKIKIRFDIRFIIILSSFIAFILIRIEHPGLCLLLSG